eukprot:1090142_1
MAPSSRLSNCKWLLLFLIPPSIVLLYFSFLPLLPDTLQNYKTQEIIASKQHDLEFHTGLNEELRKKLQQANRDLRTQQNVKNNVQSNMKRLQNKYNHDLDQLKKTKNNLSQQVITNSHLKAKVDSLTHAKNELKMDETQDTRSYAAWIRGIGDQSLSNENMTNCIFPQISETLSYDMLQSADVYHDVLTRCQNTLFSNLYARILTVQCPIEKKPMISEVDDIFSEESTFAPLMNNTIRLKDTTQMVWVTCADASDLHLSLIKKSDDTLYASKRERIHHKFGLPRNNSNLFPPNIVIFVVDAVSRSQFIRYAPMTTAYLSNLMSNPSSNTNVLEFFRYSTVGYGHDVNFAALSGGRCTTDDCAQDCIGLSQFYDKLGYYVPGFSTQNRANAEHKDSECDVYIAADVFPNNCNHSNTFNIDYAQQFVLQSLDESFGVPHFMMMDTKRNGMTDASYAHVLDKYTLSLIQNIDKTNTILHIVSAHGDYNSAQRNVYGQWESNNPVSMMLLPQHLVDEGVIDMDILRGNQQKHINHYDMNVFYKELMINLMQRTNSALSVVNKYNQLIHNTLPKVYNKGSFVLSQSILHRAISNERSCDYIEDGYCFCDVLKNNVMSKQLNEDNAGNVQVMIDQINLLTGNGELGCVALNAEHFRIVLLLSNERRIHLVIEQTPQSLGITRESSYKKYKEEGKLLAYSGDISRTKAINLFKINSFRDAHCLMNKGNRMKFVDKKWIKKLNALKQNSKYDLTLCLCK